MAAKYLKLVFCFLISINCLSAQIDSTNSRILSIPYRPKLALKCSITSVFAYTSGIELGIEHTVSPHTSLNYAANYINDFNIRRQNYKGYKLLTEYRHYNIRNKTEPNNSYSGIQISYKEIFAEGYDYIERAGGSYQQLYEIKAKTTSLDFLLTHGISESLFTKIDFIEASVSYGAKLLTLNYDSLPEGSSYNLFDRGFTSFNVTEEGQYWFPVLRLHLKVNFLLKK